MEISEGDSSAKAKQASAKQTRQVSKGVNSSLNYCNQTGVSFDLEYGFPLKFFADTKNIKVNRNFFEAVVSEGKDMLVIRDEDSIALSLTLSEIQRRFLTKFDSLLKN